MILLRVLIFALGFGVVAGTLFSAIGTVIVPRAVSARLSRIVFLTMRRVFNLAMRWSDSYENRDRLMALYAPVTLLILAVVWLVLVMLGFTAMFWAIGVASVRAAFTLSGSSLLTLGFANVGDLPQALLAVFEASSGLILIALLIAYLPTMYSAFARREATVALLAVRAGSPPSGVQMLINAQESRGLSYFTELWPAWEIWFTDLEESHTSLAALSFFRSPLANRSWVTTAGTILDAAALLLSTVDVPRDAQAALCLRAGFLCLGRIAQFFRFRAIQNLQAGDPEHERRIRVTRTEYDSACARLAAAGLPLKADREQAWRDFAGWRVNYDGALIFLSILTMAPAAPWSSDRTDRTDFFPTTRRAAELADTLRK